MFNKLVASTGRKKSFWSPTTIIVSVIIHVLLGAGAYAANLGYEKNKAKKDELVDFIELEEEKPKEPEPPKPEEPPPPEPEPEAPPPVVKGFQELIPPEEPPAVIPDVNPDQTATKAEDFSGLGKAGGVAEGVDNGVAQDVSDREAAPDEGTYELSAVEEIPSLSNRSEVQRQVERNYPPLLRDAGVTGSATLRMRVNEDGRVDAESITVESATHDQFGEAAKKAVQRMRFRPAKVGGRPVKVWVTLPIEFGLST
ncbi:MAG TPA: TonB family protein [Longimicrobiaceae bacterium]|nr:TonB family protein [Longimicrobiaceae bacterium]